MTTTEAQKTLPTHVAIIPDGNRRWAKANGLSSLEGHKRGYENALKMADLAANRGVKYLTFFAFSTENWSRSEHEVKYLMELLSLVLKHNVKDMHKKGYRLRFFGSKEGLSPAIRQGMDEAINLTKDNTTATLNLCFNYGSRRDIVEAVRRVVEDGLSLDQITEAAVSERLSSAGTPELDLLIRTSGEYRLSNMLLWEAAYAELYFVRCYWPDFNETELDKALDSYAERKRRFGS